LKAPILELDYTASAIDIGIRAAQWTISKAGKFDCKSVYDKDPV
jgi:hypothetical protein